MRCVRGLVSLTVTRLIPHVDSCPCVLCVRRSPSETRSSIRTTPSVGVWYETFYVSIRKIKELDFHTVNPNNS